MKTDLAVENESYSWREQKRQTSPREAVPIDWTESDWFRVWLQLARHENEGQEVAC